MHDISHEHQALHQAQAIAVLYCTAETVEELRKDELPQGSPFEMAKAAGFLGAKATPQLLPHRHSASIDSLQLTFEFLQEGLHQEFIPQAAFGRAGIVVRGEGKTIGRAGIGMETLTAVAVAALELFDLLKPMDSQLEISYLKLLEKDRVKSHRSKFFSTPPVCAVLACSDAKAKGKREDNSGKMAEQLLQEAGAQVKYYTVLPDQKELIQEQIKQWVAEDVQFIFTTGGTGLGPRDNTVAAVEEILERKAEGIAEAMRAYGQMRTPLAMMSRGVAGAIGETLIVTLPGSTNGVRESLEAILPAVFHARKMIKSSGF